MIPVHIFSALTLLVLLPSCRDTQMPAPDSVSQKTFFRLVLSSIVVILLEAAAGALNGAAFPGARTYFYIAMSLSFLCQRVPVALWTKYCDSVVFPKAKRPLIFYILPIFIEIAFQLFNCATGMVFTVDANNVYHREALYILAASVPVLYLAYTAAAVTVASLRLPSAQRLSYLPLLAFPLLPLIGALIQIAVYGLELICPSMAMALLVVYVAFQSRRAARQRDELARSRIAIMLSQIQPHFLFNALGAIQQLCRTDPPAAEFAVTNFSQFLRGNLDSLTDDKPISFEQELSHTRNYLTIEMLRFRERLTVVYDLRATRFRMPTLTLQPIVENAVRYSVTKCEAGATVTIATRETPRAFTVTVKDDGVGFDPALPHEDGRTHIGIQNVRDRLERMCGGSLTVCSAPGAGTTAVITIPKGEALC